MQPPPQTSYRKLFLVQGFWIAQLCLLLSALTRQPSPLYWNGHICRCDSEAEIVFRSRADRERLCCWRPLMVMSSPCARDQRVPLESFTPQQLRNATGGRDRREAVRETDKRCFGFGENRRPIICQGLEYD